MSAQLLAFATAFVLVLLAELPDKTTVAALVLSTRFRGRDVVAGATAAFAVHVALAALVGSAVAALPEQLLSATVALLFAIGAVLLLREGLQRDRDDSADASRQAPGPVTFLRGAATSFGVLFIAELGDASQLATAGLAARLGSPVAVALGAFAALVTVCALAVLLGAKIRARIRPRVLQQIAGGTFALFAIVTATQAL